MSKIVFKIYFWNCGKITGRWGLPNAFVPTCLNRSVVNYTGRFTKAVGALPAETTSGSCAVAADIDHDGDLDLFVGGRLAAQSYPRTPKSFVLRNDSHGGVVRFTDVTAAVNESLSRIGMVTDAVWTDVDHDSWPDLVLVGEWILVRLFHNDNGKLRDISTDAGLADTEGWWCRLTNADVDGDGDPDFLLGNAGTNLQFRASVDQPITCHATDIDDDGKLDAIMSYYIQGKSYPLPTRDELLGQVNPLRKQFLRYADYADATVETIMGPKLAQAQALRAVTLESSWLENDGSGHFVRKPLPRQAQVSMTNGFVQADVDLDGKPEVLAAGNFYPYKVFQGRSDASDGTVLTFANGQAHAKPLAAPLWLTGDIRDMAVLHFTKAPAAVIVARNNDKPALFTLCSTPHHH